MSSDSDSHKEKLSVDTPKDGESDRAIIQALRDKLSVQSQFISTLIHEIRNPLNTIYASVTLLENANELGEMRRYVKHLSKTSKLISEIVNDLLDMRKIDSKGYRLDPVPIDLASFGEDLLSAFKNLAINYGIELKFEQIHEILPVITIDLKLFRRILTNFLSNAFRFTEKGGRVVLRCGAEAQGKGSYKVFWEVVDSGIGISERDIPKIFEPFYKGENPSPHDEARTGLGLSICKQLAEKLGGRISCESKIGEGSCFRFSIVCPGSYPNYSYQDSGQIRYMELKHVLLFALEQEKGILLRQLNHPQIESDFASSLLTLDLNLYTHVFVDLRREGLKEFLDSIGSEHKHHLEIVGFNGKEAPYGSKDLLNMGIRCIYPGQLSHRDICSVLELKQNPVYKSNIYWFDSYKVTELLSWDAMSNDEHGRAIIDIFLQSVPSAIRCLQRACDLREWKYLQRVVTSLINSFESMGADKLLQLLGQLQDAVWDKDQALVRKLTNQLKTDHHKATKELNRYLLDYRKMSEP